MEDEPPKTYLDATGQEVPCNFTVKPEGPADSGSPFMERTLSSTNGPLPGIIPDVTEVRERRLVTPVQANQWRELDLLDNEILIGRHLIDFYGSDYPTELTRLIGYYGDDAAQPFVLFLPYRGKPAGDVVRGLMVEQEKSFQVSLMRAIRLLEMAGVVHGRISPATVRWFDVEATAQLTDFSEAVMTGDPRKAGGEAPWASAEQQSGTGLADARDDVWSAAQVIHYVVTGRLVRGRGAQPDPSPRAVALQAAFGRALDPSIESRPRARELLEKLGARDPQAPKRTPQDQAFAEGLRKFDEETAKKFPGSQRPQAGGGPSSTTPPPPSHQRKAQPPRKKGFRGWFSASLIARIGIAAFLSWWWS